MHILSRIEHGEADIFYKLGCYNRKLLLFSKHELFLNVCELGEEYGGGRLTVMTPTTCSEA